jgi:hypothetical protein
MLNTIYKPWVKYVNNHRNTACTTSGYTSTKNLSSQQIHTSYWVQIYLNRFTFLYFNPMISTYKYTISNLLNKSFTHNPQHLLLEPLNEI